MGEGGEEGFWYHEKLPSDIPKMGGIMRSNRIVPGWSWMVILLLLPAQAGAFGYTFEEDAYVNLWPAYSNGSNPVQFSLQHYYQSGYIYSANMRGGYAFAKRACAYASLLYHGNDEAMIRMSEPEGKIYLSPYLQKDGRPFSLSVAAGASIPEYGDYFTAVRGPVANRKVHLSGELPVTRKWGDRVDATLAPTLVYSDGLYVDGINCGLRLVPIPKVALVGEFPVLFSNPYDYDPLWAAGVQLHVGPHSLTGFMTNASGFTISNLLRGTKERFAGFRFTF
jgi:hypothetical protein